MRLAIVAAASYARTRGAISLARAPDDRDALVERLEEAGGRLVVETPVAGGGLVAFIAEHAPRAESLLLALRLQVTLEGGEACLALDGRSAHGAPLSHLIAASAGAPRRALWLDLATAAEPERVATALAAAALPDGTELVASVSPLVGPRDRATAPLFAALGAALLDRPLPGVPVTVARAADVARARLAGSVLVQRSGLPSLVLVPARGPQTSDPDLAPPPSVRGRASSPREGDASSALDAALYAGEAALAGARLAVAATEFRRALLLAATRPPAVRADVHTRLGRVKEAEGALPEAANHFEKALGLDAGHVEAARRVVPLLLAARDFQGLERVQLRRVAQLVAEGDRAELLADLAAVWLDQAADAHKALVLVERALAVAPRHVRALELGERAAGVLGRASQVEAFRARRAKL